MRPNPYRLGELLCKVGSQTMGVLMTSDDAKIAKYSIVQITES